MEAESRAYNMLPDINSGDGAGGIADRTLDGFQAETATPLRHSPAVIIILFIGYITVMLVGLIGNTFVVAIVAKTPKLRTVTNYFILNLALADLLVLTFCLPPTLISNVYVPWVMGWLLCKAVPYVQGVAVCASVYSLVAISADRFSAIWFPLRRQITKRSARRIMVIIWMWAATLALPWLLYFDLSNADKKQPSLLFCVETWPARLNGNVYFVIVNLFLFYLFPFALISLCYFCIWLRVWHRRVPTDSSVSQTVLIHQRAKASVLKMVVVVVVAFVASWLPLYAIFVRLKLIPSELSSLEEHVLDLALPIAQWLGASNSCVNPILYAFFNGHFRSAFCKLLRGSKPSPPYPAPLHARSRCNDPALSNTLKNQLMVNLHTRTVESDRINRGTNTHVALVKNGAIKTCEF